MTERRVYANKNNMTTIKSGQSQENDASRRLQRDGYTVSEKKNPFYLLTFLFNFALVSNKTKKKKK